MEGKTELVYFTQEEMEEIAASVAEAQREFDVFAAWCKTLEAKAEGIQILREAEQTWAKLEAEIAAGKYSLSPAELEQLNRGGFLRKCHPIKRGAAE